MQATADLHADHTVPDRPRRGRGKAQKSLELINAAHRILSEIQPASVRAVCYKLFSQKLIPSMAKCETNKVGTQLTWARERGLIPWEWIVDGTRTIERPSSWESPADLLSAAAQQYRRDWWELDALDPNVLRDRVEQQIRDLIDWSAWERCTRVEEAERASLLEVVGSWKESRR